MVLKTDNNPANLVIDQNSKFLEMKSVQPYNSTDEYLYAMKEDLAEWLSSMYNESITADNFIESLENGVLLCKHANNVNEAARNALKLNLVDHYDTKITNENCIYRENSRPQTFNARDNVSNFIKWCRKVGVREVLMFESDDLILRKNEKNFLFCLLEIARYGAKFGVSVPNIIRLEKEIEEEIQRDKQEEIMSFTELQRLQRSVKKNSIGSIKASHRYSKLLNFVRNEHHDNSMPIERASSSPPPPVLTKQISLTDDSNLTKLKSIEPDNIDSQNIYTNSSSTLSLQSKSNNYSTFSLTHSNGANWLRSKIPKFSKKRRSSEGSNFNSAITSIETDTTIVESRTLGESYETDTLDTTATTKSTSQLHKTVCKMMNACCCPQKFPVIQIGEGKYRIGQSGTIVFIRILRNHVMVRVGGGWDTLENYLNKHDPCRWHRRTETHVEQSESPIIAVPTIMKLNAMKPKNFSGGQPVALRTEQFPLRPTTGGGDLQGAELVITRGVDGRHRIGQIVYKSEEDLLKPRNNHSEKCQHHDTLPKEITPRKSKGLSVRGTGVEYPSTPAKLPVSSETIVESSKPLLNEEPEIVSSAINRKETNESPETSENSETKTVTNDVKPISDELLNINSVDDNKNKLDENHHRDSSIKKAIPENKSNVYKTSLSLDAKGTELINKEKDQYSRRRTEPIDLTLPNKGMLKDTRTVQNLSLVLSDIRHHEQKQLKAIENTSERDNKHSARLYSKKSNTIPCIVEYPKISTNDHDDGSTQHVNDTNFITESTRPHLPWDFQSNESYQHVLKHQEEETQKRSQNVLLDDNSSHFDVPFEETLLSSSESKNPMFDEWNENDMTQGVSDVLNAIGPIEKKQLGITESIISNIDGFTQSQQNDFDLNDIEDAMIGVKSKETTDIKNEDNMDGDSLESYEAIIDNKVNRDKSKTLTALFMEQKQKQPPTYKRPSLPQTTTNKPFHPKLAYCRSNTMPDVIVAVSDQKVSRGRRRQPFITSARGEKRSDSVHSSDSSRTTTVTTTMKNNPQSRPSLVEQKRHSQSTEVLSNSTKNNNIKHRSNHLAYDRDSGFDEQDFRRERLRSEDDSSSIVSDGSTFRSSYGDVKYRENKAYELRLKALDFTKILNEKHAQEPRMKSLHNRRNYNYAETKGSEVIYGTTPRVRLSGKYRKNGDNYLTMKMLQTHNDNTE
ncbi:unnamed protein product [Didymodactylos carnosus]|uniref:GAS2-like protein 1 n=1 Tax=Didymodactylos carnosus TaxID=1234261 RepID=A0A8S2GDL8_9BILA|nr:unnamed protein product [Didymodactylos carnosus]CAF3496854.1 unnamed protein product [Didymodactylos carnosus]